MCSQGVDIKEGAVILSQCALLNIYKPTLELPLSLILVNGYNYNNFKINTNVA